MKFPITADELKSQNLHFDLYAAKFPYHWEATPRPDYINIIDNSAGIMMLIEIIGLIVENSSEIESK